MPWRRRWAKTTRTNRTVPEYFVVDRSSTCVAGQILNLQGATYTFQHQTSGIESPDEIAGTMAMMYPDGVSIHGQRYLFERSQTAQGGYLINNLVEIVVELVRRSNFQEIPSRFTSLFGWETSEAAQTFRQRSCQPFHPIIRVETDQPGFKADMELLKLGVSVASALTLANKYWKGESSANPCWEILLQPPVRVIERVEPI
jgi:hypothetical protein